MKRVHVLGNKQFPTVLGNSVANIGLHLLFQIAQPLLFPSHTASSNRIFYPSVVLSHLTASGYLCAYIVPSA